MIFHGYVQLKENQDNWILYPISLLIINSSVGVCKGGWGTGEMGRIGMHDVNITKNQ